MGIMPLSEKELQLIPQLEKLSVSMELSGSRNSKNQLSSTERKKIIQIARIINSQRPNESPRQKFRKNLEKSIENHMKRMATSTGKNIRIIKPPPSGLKVLKNGEWMIPKTEQKANKTSVERAKQLLSQVPMTIPNLEPASIKRSRKPRIRKRKPKESVKFSTKPNRRIHMSDAEQTVMFQKVFSDFMKKRKEFATSAKHLQEHLKGIGIESSATHLIAKTISDLSQSDGNVVTLENQKPQRKTPVRNSQVSADHMESSSCPVLVRRVKKKKIHRNSSSHHSMAR